MKMNYTIFNLITNLRQMTELYIFIYLFTNLYFNIVNSYIPSYSFKFTPNSFRKLLYMPLKYEI